MVLATSSSSPSLRPASSEGTNSRRSRWPAAEASGNPAATAPPASGGDESRGNSMPSLTQGQGSRGGAAVAALPVNGQADRRLGSSQRQASAPNLRAVGGKQGSDILLPACSVQGRRGANGSRPASVQDVRRYLTTMDESMHLRQPGRLCDALKDLHGTKYLQLMAEMRKNRTLSAYQRHGLELEMANKVVRARVMLDQWRLGVNEIHEARREHNPETLQTALQAWHFAESDPEIEAARQDLEKWRFIEQDLPPLLQDAILSKDIPRLRELVQDASATGLRNIPKLSDAKKVCKKYDKQRQALHDAVGGRSASNIQIALNSWEFDQGDEVVVAAKATLAKHEEQLGALREAAGSQRPSGPRLQAACDAWQYDQDGEAYLSAKRILDQYLVEIAKLQAIVDSAPTDFVELYDALQVWSFADDGSEAADVDLELERAKAKLEGYRSSLEKALRDADGWEVRRLWEAGGSGAALGEEADTSPYEEMINRHGGAVEELWERVVAALDLQVDAEPDISRLVQEWAFAQSDPVLDFARNWLRLYNRAKEQSAAQLTAVTAAGIASCAQGALLRRQGHSAEDAAVRSAEVLVVTRDQARQVAGALAHGVPPARVPLAQESKRAAAFEKEEHAKAVLKQVDLKGVLQIISGSVDPPPGICEVIHVCTCFLAGVHPSVPDPPPKATSGRPRPAISNAVELAVGLDSVFNRVAIGQRSGVFHAREAFNFYSTFAAKKGEEWSTEAMRKQSSSAGLLLEYAECVFEFAQLLQSLDECVKQTDSDVSAIWQAGAAPPTALKGGIEVGACSPILTAAWALCGGEASEIEDCLERARAHSEEMQRRLTESNQAVQDLVGSLDGATASADTGSSRTPADTEMISIVVRQLSGETEVRIRISAGALATELKDRVAKAEGTPSEVQRLLLGSVPLQDHMSLAAQGVTRSDTVLTLLKVPAPLDLRVQRLESLLKAMDATAFETSEDSASAEAAAHIVWSACRSHASAQELFGVPPECEKLHEAMLQALSSLSRVLSGTKASPNGEIPGAAGAGRLSLKQRVWPLPAEAYEVPLACLAAAEYALTKVTSKSQVASAVAEFVGVMRAAYLELIPLQTARIAAAAGAAEAVEALRVATHAKAVSSELAPPSPAMGELPEPASAPGPACIERALGLGFPAPHVAWAQKAASLRIEALLKEPPAPNSPSLWVTWTDAVLTAALCPLIYLEGALSRIAGQCNLPSNMSKLDVPQFQLLSVIIGLLLCGPCRIGDIQQRVANPSKFKSSLEAWSPIKSQPPAALLEESSRMLLALWDWFESGCYGHEHFQVLYAWASLGVALAPLWDQGEALAPAQRAISAAKQCIQSTDSDYAWAQVRWALHRHCEEEPWWWLRLLGCEAPETFYRSHGLEPEPKFVALTQAVVEPEADADVTSPTGDSQPDSPMQADSAEAVAPRLAATDSADPPSSGNQESGVGQSEKTASGGQRLEPGASAGDLSAGPSQELDPGSPTSDGFEPLSPTSPQSVTNRTLTHMSTGYEEDFEGASPTATQALTHASTGYEDDFEGASPTATRALTNMSAGYEDDFEGASPTATEAAGGATSTVLHVEGTMGFELDDEFEAEPQEANAASGTEVSKAADPDGGTKESEKKVTTRDPDPDDDYDYFEADDEVGGGAASPEGPLDRQGSEGGYSFEGSPEVSRSLQLERSPNGQTQSPTSPAEESFSA